MEENINKADIIGKTFVDSFAHEHTIQKVIGEGGQGMVCKSDAKGCVLKFVFDEKGELISESENEPLFEYNKAIFNRVRRLPIPYGCHAAVPIAVLQDYSGYVMRLMDDMRPLSSLIGDAKTFLETGGHRYRLEVLSKCASVLAQMHSAGLVYCDISANNVFVTESAEGENQNVWFIDTDNLFVQGSGEKLVYTPRYAAPEIIRAKTDSCSQNSDLYSFAVLAFECLSMIHPFAGDATQGDESEEGGGWDETDAGEGEDGSEMDPAYTGEFAWVEDVSDKSNHTSDGFPRKLFLTDELFTLFNQTFTEGKENPEARPTAYFWQKALAAASDQTLKCPECKMSHVYDETLTECPYCGAPLPDVLKICEEASGKIVFVREITLGAKIQVPERILVPFDTKYNSLPALVILIEQEQEEDDGVVVLKDEFEVMIEDEFDVTIKKTDVDFFSSLRVNVLFEGKNKILSTAAQTFPLSKSEGKIEIATSFKGAKEKTFCVSIS